MAYVSIDKAFKENPLLSKALEFSLSIIRYVESLEATRHYIVANQLLRAATSIGANAVEAQSAESKADFIHKLKIADKEAHETYYWLTICKESPNYPRPDGLFSLLSEILKLLSSIIRSSKNIQSSTNSPN